MSSYQYLEFVAVERPLDERARAEMRNVSSRGDITARRFVNEYHYGDFKGDAVDWMTRWFDAHVYSSSWGRCTLMLGVPRATLSPSAVVDFAPVSVARRRFGSGHAFTAWERADRWILQWTFDDEGEGEHERFWSDDGPGWMDRLLPLRDELLRGDHRSLYLGWLARVCAGEIEESDADALEPPLPPGLGELGDAQRALTEFLLIDPDWLAAAAAASAPLSEANAGVELERFVEGLSAETLRGTARALLEGQAAEAERALRGEWLAWRTEAAAKAGRGRVPERRSVAVIATELDAVRARRLETERRATEHAAREREKARAAHLDTVLERLDASWKRVEELLERGTSSAYDEALVRVTELSEALGHVGRGAEFRRRLERLQETHARRRAWHRRLVSAGLLE